MNTAGGSLRALISVAVFMAHCFAQTITFNSRVNQSLPVTVKVGGATVGLAARGRVGNWVSTGTTSGEIVFDISVTGAGSSITTAYMAPQVQSPTGTSVTLNATPLFDSSYTNYISDLATHYVGNAWICPGNDIILFQESANSAKGGAYNPGAGVDNNVWVVQESEKYLKKLTTNVSGGGHGVVGPMCSQDSGDGNYHIVYEYSNNEVSNFIQGVTPAGCSTLGKSNGTCGW